MSTIELTPEEARERLVLKAKERKERIDVNHEKALGVIQSVCRPSLIFYNKYFMTLLG
jgi:hypothetical protein